MCFGGKKKKGIYIFGRGLRERSEEVSMGIVFFVLGCIFKLFFFFEELICIDNFI